MAKAKKAAARAKPRGKRPGGEGKNRLPHKDGCLCAWCEDDRDEARRTLRRERDQRRKARQKKAGALAAKRAAARVKGRGLGALLGGGRGKPLVLEGGTGLEGRRVPVPKVRSQTFDAGGTWVAPPGVEYVVVTASGGGGGGAADLPLRIDLGHAVRRDLEALLRTGLFGLTVEKVAEGILLAELRRLIREGWTNGTWARRASSLEAELDRMRAGVKRGIEKAVRRGAKASVTLARTGKAARR